jgi:hypothetical protein
MGKYNDFQNDHGVVHAASLGAITANSPGLDTKGMEQCTVLGMTGVLAATDTVDIKVQHSDDDGVGDAYADLAGAAFAQQVDADDNVLLLGKIKCNTAGVKRWLRVVVINGGAATTGSGAGMLISQNLSGHMPLTVNALPAPAFNLFNP